MLKMIKKIKKKVEMICTMTDAEMKLMVSCLEFKLQDKIDNDLESVIDLKTLIKKLNIMIERQTPYE